MEHYGIPFRPIIFLFRLGEMEKDVCISTGITKFLNESTFQLSDVYQIDVCGGCGNILSSENSCRVCKHDPNSASKIGTVDMPYCFKLLLQELNSLGVRTSINIK
jgi:DNA-directed RNA polymerase III subunit RPC2